MSEQKKNFLDSRIYPVLFMIIVTVIFVGMLATFYQFTRERVNLYQKEQLNITILQLFDLPTERLESNFQKFIQAKEKKNLKYYQAVKDSVILGYCFPISGKGLWGRIDALIALTQDLSKIIELEIIEQNETPGLGGRITESWFKKQFENKLIISNEVVQAFELISEGESNNDRQIQQITGATASSKAIVDMIYNNVKLIKEFGI